MLSRAIYKELNEASYSRIYQHTQDDSTFAIIGSEDKDTKKNRYKELKELIKGVMVKNSNIGYNKINGTYTYKLTGETTFEKGLMIYNISKEDAIAIAAKLNQESIIWKDPSFFGVIELNGKVLDQFDDDGVIGMNFNKAKTAGFGTRLQKDDTNPSRIMGFAFEGERIRMKNLSTSILKEVKAEPGNDFESKKNFLYSMYDKIKEAWEAIDWHDEMYYEMDMDIDNMILIISVTWGDWKHDHAAIDQIAKEATHPIKIEEVVTEEDGSDCYSADHYFYYAPLKKESAPVKRVNNNLSAAILEATDEEYEAYMKHEKELADEYYKRLCDDITEERRQKFNDLKALTDDDRDSEKEEWNGFWIPKDFAYAVTDAGKGHHLNPYMDLTVSNIYFLVYENDTIEAALKSLFDEYKADSAFSWGDNFLYALDKANPNAYNEFVDEQTEWEDDEIENDEEE